MSSPKVSLVIPTHRREQLLRELLLALEHQTLPRDQFEVIVVMDGLADPAWPVLQSLQVGYRLRPVRQEQSGASVTRNHGARIAHGEVLVFLDDDMLPGERFLEEHLRVHQAHPHTVVLGAYVPPPMELVERHGGWNVWEARVLERHYRLVANGGRPPAGRRLYSGNFSVRREDFWQAGGFDERLERGEDIELGFRLQRQGVDYRFAAGTGAVHRGFRGFESWCRSAYLYGQSDAQLGRQDAGAGLSEPLDWFHRQKPVTRWAVRACVERPLVYKLMVWLLAFLAHQLSDLRQHRLAHYGYGAIHKLQYWRGFIEAVGGRPAFERLVAAHGAGQREHRAPEHQIAPTTTPPQYGPLATSLME